MLVELDGCRWSAVVDLVVMGVAHVGDIIKIVGKKSILNPKLVEVRRNEP
jgi:hypothetical protein